MLQIYFSAVAVLYTGLLFATFRRAAGVPEWLLRLLLLGLITDNVVLGLSPIGMGQDWYYTANIMRYLAHVLALPPLVVAALYVARRADVAWAHGLTTLLMAGIFVIAAIDVGIVTEIAGLRLVPETLAGHERLISAHASPPLATIATNIVLIVTGAAIWRVSGWPWLFAATLFILLVNGATAALPWGIVAGNMAEIVFVAGWLLTLQRFPAEAH
jgi:hypothetical protein